MADFVVRLFQVVLLIWKIFINTINLLDLYFRLERAVAEFWLRFEILFLALLAIARKGGGRMRGHHPLMNFMILVLNRCLPSFSVLPFAFISRSIFLRRTPVLRVSVVIVRPIRSPKRMLILGTLQQVPPLSRRLVVIIFVLDVHARMRRLLPRLLGRALLGRLPWRLVGHGRVARSAVLVSPLSLWHEARRVGCLRPQLVPLPLRPIERGVALVRLVLLIVLHSVLSLMGSFEIHNY